MSKKHMAGLQVRTLNAPLILSQMSILKIREAKRLTESHSIALSTHLFV